MDSNLQNKKTKLVKSIIRFLRDESESIELNADQKECVEVAVQCLESAYNLEGAPYKDVPSILDLVRDAVTVQDVTDEDKANAELHKVSGNDHMKAGNYQEALEAYTNWYLCMISSQRKESVSHGFQLNDQDKIKYFAAPNVINILHRAINLNPTNAVYYCNRAAAYSRLERHHEAIVDCKEAIRLDSSYGKAYGRLGIAYSNLNQFQEAKVAYTKALQLDAGNPMYEANLKLAEEKLQAEAAANPHNKITSDFVQVMNNPGFMNIASQMLNDPMFHDMMSGIMNVNEESNPNVNMLMQVGQQLASQMANTNPSLVENLRRSFTENPSTSNSRQTQEGSSDADKVNKKPES